MNLKEQKMTEKEKTLEERKQDFCYWCACDLLDKPVEMVLAFQEYWTEHSPKGKLMRWEKEKVFDMKRRFKTWEQNNLKWHKPKEQKLGFMESHLKSTEEAKKLLGL